MSCKLPLQWTECLYSPKTYILKPNSQCDSFKGGAFGKWYRHENRAFMIGVSGLSHERGPQMAPLGPLLCEGRARKPPVNRKQALVRCHLYQHLSLGSQPLELWETHVKHFFLVYEPPYLWNSPKYPKQSKMSISW